MPPWFRPRLCLALAAWAWICWVSLAAADQVLGTAVDIETSATGWSPYSHNDPWLFFEAEYQYLWARGAYLPPLVTTSPVGDGIENAGVLGEPGTVLLFGDDRTSSGPRSGLRLRGTAAIDIPHRWWLIADWFALPADADRFVASSPGDPILARPFDDRAIGGPNAELVSFPDLVAGCIRVEASHDVWGAGIAVCRNLVHLPGDRGESGSRVDLLIGYRFLELTDNVWIDERLRVTATSSPILLDTEFGVSDEYRSVSRFHGVDLGLRGEWSRNRYFVSGELRAALGQADHCLDQFGWTAVSVPGVGAVSFPGGLLVGSQTMGVSRDREFAVVPQAELRVGRQITDQLRLSVGYSFLYWSQVVRAGEHIATTIDSTQLPSADSHPAATHEIPLFSSSYWTQGITANLEWRY